jgi:hypothetical protein
MTDDDTTEMPLDDTQTRRAAALAFARSALIDSTNSPFTGSEVIPKRFGTSDLIDVAQWVLEGTDPLADYRAGLPTIITVPDDQVQAVSDLNSGTDHPGGLLIVPASAKRINFPLADAAGSEAGCS